MLRPELMDMPERDLRWEVLTAARDGRREAWEEALQIWQQRFPKSIKLDLTNHDFPKKGVR